MLLSVALSVAAQHSFQPGKPWLDTSGNPIDAHGGGLLHDTESGRYYWYRLIRRHRPLC